MKINMLSYFLKDTYGHKVYKLLLSSGLTCPNRDGKLGEGGCIFCSGGGSGEFATNFAPNIDSQVEEAKSKLSVKEREYDKFIAYFQAFSNTYGKPNYLEKLYKSVIMRDDIIILSIATRPDCFSDEVYELLKELNEIKPVWVELGLQTSNDKTAEFINRSYDTSVYIETADKLRTLGINVITHIILGLPNESKEDMLNTARLVGEHSDGVKFHNLYVLKNTRLAQLYSKGEIKLLTLEEYTDVLLECIRLLPSDIVIHRLTGDPPKDELIAPKWCENKIKLIREINNALYDRDVIQGENYRKATV
ncbi:MAG: TIGR01212 family radical SAM protein [Eubacteriales bacterium]|nr:TIGR01212 family radical SAM protein [Eubacteriales bacterium]